MSDDLLKQAPFLPAAPPRQAIIDLSGSLSRDQLAALEAQAAGLACKVKVVVLPKDFTATDPQQFARQLGQRWDVEAGRRFLMVVDLKAHKVRGLSSGELNASGLTSSAISKDIIADNFIPYMRKGDLEGAISHSLAAVEKTLSAHTAAVSQAEGRPASLSYGQPVSEGGGACALWPILVLAALVLAVFALAFRSRSNKNRKLRAELNERASSLYDKADQIGQASEYMDPARHPELAQQVAIFFNRLTTLDRAMAELEQLAHRRKVWKAAEAISNCLRLVHVLESDAQSLLKRVNGVTGGVEAAFTPPARETPALEDKSREAVVGKVQFHRPAWTLEPAYHSGPLVVSPGGGLLDLMFLINQLETNRRLDQLAYEVHHHDGHPSAGLTDEGDWSGVSPSIGEGGGYWADSGADAGWADGGFGGADGGGGWGEAGGGDFGGGDGGGSW